MNQYNNKNLVLGKEIYRSLHNWPLIVMFILAGGLIGYLSSYFWPSPYEASLSLFVNLNPYRTQDNQPVEAFSQVDFRNVDDFKHWQMSQLNVLMLSDEYLQETLKRLAADDNYWKNVDAGELRKLLQLFWRNAGEWKLAANDRDPDRASRVVETWRQVILDKVNLALENSRKLYDLESEQAAVLNEIIDIQTHQLALRDIRQTLIKLSDQYANHPPDQPLEIIDRQNLLVLIARASNPESEWEYLLDNLPSENAGYKEYDPWIDQVLLLIENELDSLDGQLVDLRTELVDINESWDESLTASQGLSVSLAVEVQDRSAPVVENVRETGLVVFIGAVLGFLGWGILVLLQIARRIQT
jgi:hypothetical protein